MLYGTSYWIIVNKVGSHIGRLAFRRKVFGPLAVDGAGNSTLGFQVDGGERWQNPGLLPRALIPYNRRTQYYAAGRREVV